MKNGQPILHGFEGIVNKSVKKEKMVFLKYKSLKPIKLVIKTEIYYWCEQDTKTIRDSRKENLARNRPVKCRTRYEEIGLRCSIEKINQWTKKKNIMK